MSTISLAVFLSTIGGIQYPSELQSAVYKLDLAEVNKITRSLPRGPKALDSFPRILSACWSGKDRIHEREQVLKALLATGANPNRQEGAEQGSLEGVVQFGSPKMLEMLLEAGLEPEPGIGTRNQPYVFLLQRTIEYNQPEMLKLLLEHGASPIEACAYRGWDPKKGKNGFGIPKFPLHVAAYAGSDTCLRILLESGARVDQRGSFGETPLYSAVMGLSKHQFKEYWTPKSGRTWSEDCPQVLLEAGANPKLRSDSGETPLELAKRKNLANLVALMAKYVR